jgi:DNA-directed RNA polymerase subunit M/transcription elongation factor TFIIS
LEKCPKCGEDAKLVKKWFYGPKTRKGANFEVLFVECAKGHRSKLYKKKA